MYAGRDALDVKGAEGLDAVESDKGGVDGRVVRAGGGSSGCGLLMGVECSRLSRRCGWLCGLALSSCEAGPTHVIRVNRPWLASQGAVSISKVVRKLVVKILHVCSTSLLSDMKL